MPDYTQDDEICFRDKQGRVRLRIGLSGDGSPAIHLFNEFEQPACVVGLLDNGPYMELQDLSGKTRMQVAVHNGSTIAALRGGLDTGTLIATLDEEGADLKLIDQRGSEYELVKKKSCACRD